MEGITDTPKSSEEGIRFKEYHFNGEPEWNIEITNSMPVDGHNERFLIGVLNEEETRKMIAWLKENKPEILRDVMCEDCPEVC